MPRQRNWELDKKIAELYLKGFRPKEIARALGVSDSVVRYRLWRLKQEGILKPLPSIEALRERLRFMHARLEQAVILIRYGNMSTEHMARLIHALYEDMSGILQLVEAVYAALYGVGL